MKNERARDKQERTTGRVKERWVQLIGNQCCNGAALEAIIRPIYESALIAVFVRLFMNEWSRSSRTIKTIVHSLIRWTHFFHRYLVSFVLLKSSSPVFSCLVFVVVNVIVVWNTREQRRMRKSNWARNEIVQKKILFLSSTGFLLFLSSSPIMDSCGRTAAKMSFFFLKKGVPVIKAAKGKITISLNPDKQP